MMTKTFALAMWAMFILSGAAGAQTTQAADDGPPVPAVAAPSYIAMGKELAMHLDLVRENVAELKLDDSVRAQANALITGVSGEIDFLLTEMQAGRMPGTNRVMAVPTKLKTARQQLLQLIAPDQAKLLQDKLQSIRGEARLRLGELRNMIEDLKLDPQTHAKTDAVLAKAHKKIDELPDGPVADDESKSRDAMNRLFGETHDEIAGLLPADQQQQLGPKFAQLAYVAAEPATRP